ncbi:NAD-dependent epimerase/dehydratase family protein, partial [Asaia bogorensis]
MRFLITGGAGFVGSHVAISLLDAGHEVVILDNLSTGHRKAIPTGARFELIDLANAVDTNSLVSEGRWDAVLHFAALSLVGASMAEPYTYLRQNTIT